MNCLYVLLGDLLNLKIFQVSSGVVRLKLNKQRQKKVSWTNETVDNENMGKKKSKCKFLCVSKLIILANKY